MATFILVPLLLTSCYHVTSNIASDVKPTPTPTTSTTDIFTGDFHLYTEVAKPGNASESSCTVKEVRYSRLECLDLCMRDDSCASVYMELVTNSNSSSSSSSSSSSGHSTWICYLCSDFWQSESLTPGDGHIAAAKYQPRFLDTLSQPALSGASKVGVQVVNGALAAVYECWNNADNQILLAYDKENDRFPSMSQPCQADLCVRQYMVNRVLRVVVASQSPHRVIYHAYQVCRPDERPLGYAECQGVFWLEYDYNFEMCIPHNCSKLNMFNRPVYAGTQNTTKLGKTCQRWDEKLPHVQFYMDPPLNDLFKLDDKNATLAENYCRAVGEFYLWCFTTDPLFRFEVCEVPECEY